MSEIQDHIVYCPEGFYDMQRYPERIEHGKTITVSKVVFRQMKGSDPSIELKGIQPPQDVLERIVGAAREAQVADPVEEFEPTEEYQKALDADGDTLVDPPEDIEEFKPIGWYAAQLAKDGGMDD